MLEGKDIGFGYDEKKCVLEGISLSVERNERLWIAAPSGMGKTTLCRILTGYLNPTHGTVVVDGELLDTKGKCQVQLIGQHPERMLDPRMRLSSSIAEGGAPNIDLLNALGIQQGWMHRFPHELSGGQLQRFCIARALLAKPSYLVADEIFTMLDTVTQAAIWRIILKACEEYGIGLVFTTHSDALARRIATSEYRLQ